MAPDDIWHNPNADTGMEGFLAYFKQFGGGRQAVPDRIADGTIVEHWDSDQKI